jgi:putative aminopeptidase FrvX
MRRLISLVAMAAFLPHSLAAQGAPRAPLTSAARLAAAERLLHELTEVYGVSGMEDPVRAAIQAHLPAWARPETDSAGNLWVRAGQGGAPVVFVAHMDEIGFRVTEIREDGSLELATRGGFFPSLYEARPALVHTGSASIPGVFPPRDSLRTRRQPPPLRVDVGTTSRAATEALGIRVGHTVTSPKSYARLAGTRATARSFDDRVGCVALLQALAELDPRRLKHEVIFVWSVREEIGLEGARAVADALGTTPARVHAIDTFVSADHPAEPQAYAVAPLGKGPVIRALDNSSVTPLALVDSLLALARAAQAPLQFGTTSGGNDGSTFLPWGVPDVPIGWPLRYSHSPAEVADLRDVAGLALLVRLVAERW